MEAVEAIYWSPPSAEVVARGGYKLEDFPEPVVEVEDELWPALMLFNDNKSQVRVAFGGVIGLDYNVFFHEIERMNVSKEQYDEIMDYIRVIERVAVNCLNRHN